MRYLSVCSGIEAASVAWHPLGWEAAAFSEIEKLQSAVLSHHYPEVPNHGDFTTIKGDEYGAVDLLVGGTPCQSFSIAGNERGLDDPNGQLSIEFIKLARRTGARWILWENVPGVLRNDSGRSFAMFLDTLEKHGYGFAYRILDTRFTRTTKFPHGIPHRRRRLFVVGYLGDWRPPAAILCDPSNLRNLPQQTRPIPQTPESRITGTATKLRHVAQFEFAVKEIYGNICPTLQTGKQCVVVITENADGEVLIRYLTPLERERLQGFPDNYTLVPFKGKPMSDHARYIMLGNSMSTNVMQYLGEQIQKYETYKRGE